MNKHSDVQVGDAGSPLLRRREICRLAEQQGRVQIHELAAVYGVQPITIRRDLDELAAGGRLIRVRGGALRNERVRFEFEYAHRMDQNYAEKGAIAKQAAAMVLPGQTLILDTGSTTQLLARELASRSNLQIVTNSMVVAYELRSALGISVILLGGQARPGGFELIGPLTERLLADFKADIAFLGADAIDLGGGFYSTDLGVARTEELMIRAAATAVVLADASKLGRLAFARYATFKQIDTWICCGTLRDEWRRQVSRIPTRFVEVQCRRTSHAGE